MKRFVVYCMVIVAIVAGAETVAAEGSTPAPTPSRAELAYRIYLLRVRVNHLRARLDVKSVSIRQLQRRASDDETAIDHLQDEITALQTPP